MFTHPYIGSELAGDRQREKLARADQHRLARQLRDHARASRRTQRARQRPRRALAQPCGCAHKCRHDITAGQHGGQHCGPRPPRRPGPADCMNGSASSAPGMFSDRQRAGAPSLGTSSAAHTELCP